MIVTNYGKKIEGSSRFVIVAPHAAGDDLKTGYIASKIAEALKGFAVINTVYKKPTNSGATPENTEDFNQLTWWAAEQKYLWFRPRRRHPDMRQFFKDIREYTKLAREFSLDKKAVCIHIHGMKSVTEALDLGIGKDFENNTTEKNSGVQTLELEHVQQLQQALEQETLAEWGLKVSLGKYCGISRQSAIQFHAHGQSFDHALQIEISSFLRCDEERRNNIIQIIVKNLTTLF